MKPRKIIIFKVKQEWHETDICLAELAIQLPKPREEIRTPIPKPLPTFTSEGKSNYSLNPFYYSPGFFFF